MTVSSSLPTAGWLPPVPAFTIVFPNAHYRLFVKYSGSRIPMHHLAKAFSLAISELRGHPAELVCVVLMCYYRKLCFHLKWPHDNRFKPTESECFLDTFDGRGTAVLAGRSVKAPPEPSFPSTITFNVLNFRRKVTLRRKRVHDVKPFFCITIIFDLDFITDFPAGSNIEPQLGIPSDSFDR